MKSLKKFLALALALALCFAMALPAMATETTGTEAVDQELTLENATPGHTYSVYQIFTGTIGKDDKNRDVLANIKYGANFGGFDKDNRQDPDTTVDSSVVDAINNAKEGFANDLINALRGNPIATLPAEESSYTITVKTGYYLIVDNGANPDIKDPLSAVMVEVVGATSVKTKVEDTTMKKTVQTVDPNTFTDDAGHTIGETFQFKLEAKIPVNQLKAFDKYMIRFKDTMSDGLTFDSIDSVKVTNKDDAIPAKADGKAGYVFQYTNGNYEAEENQSPENKAGVSFTVEIENLFAFIGDKDWPTVSETVGEGDKAVTTEYVVVTLTYNAHLNENAIVMGSGTTEETTLGDNNANKNTGSLDFTRKPGDDGEGSTTPDDTYVFTLKLDGTKYKNNVADENKLAGAEFTLYKANKSGEGDSATWSKGDAIKFKKNTEGNWTVYTGNETEGVQTFVPSGDDGKFVFNGLGPGDYILSETKVPEGGYNRSADILIHVTEKNKNEEDHIITCDATMKYIGNEDVTDADAEKLNEDNTNPVGNTGLALNVINKTGSFLPSTGGIGTTIFYAVGGALVVGAGILLFVKKRMGSKG